MTGSVVKRVKHTCADGRAKWVQMPQRRTEASLRPCKCGANVTRGDIKKGEIKYDALWWAGGKQRSKTFDTKHDADKYLAKIVSATQDGNYVAVAPIPMGELFDKWLEHSLAVRRKQGLLKPSTSKGYESMVRVHLRPAFEHCRSDRLSPAIVGEWERKMADRIEAGEMTPKSFNHLVALLHVILKWARKSGQRYLAHDPLIDVARLRAPKTERRFLEPAQITALLEAAERPVDTILHLFVYSGLRRGEVFGLQWSDLDEDLNQIRVRRSNYQCEITTPKTTNSIRTVDLPAPIVKKLLDYKEQFPPKPRDFIFRQESGSPLDPDKWFDRNFVPTAIKAGLRPENISEHDEQLIGLHTLRHTYASLLINQGESIKYVSKQLGHASIQLTADLYGHLFKETSVSAMNKLAMRIHGGNTGGKVVSIGTGTEG
jgi:integrase